MSHEKLIFLHQVSNKTIHNDKKVIHEEEVVHGPKGLKFKYYHKEGDKIQKIVGVQTADGSFVVITTVGDKKDSQTLSKDEVIKMLTKEKHLKFALDYIKNLKGGRRGSRKVSRKGSKKGSKKGSRKGSRKGSKKGSKMAGGKRGSRKGSRKTSRKTSRKGSKKTSRK